MVSTTRLRRQDGFIREVLWLCLVLAIIAIVLLDGMAIFGGHQSAKDDADQASQEARTAYAQSQDVDQARTAADQYLLKSGDELAGFEVTKNLAGDIAFEVTAKTEVKTYGFKYLAYIPPLKKWVRHVEHPRATETAD